MKKSVRRIVLLSLVLILVCSLAVSSFAVSGFLADTCEGINIEMLGTLERYDAEGEIIVDCIYGASYYKIDAALTYYPKPGGSPSISAEPHSSSATYYTSGSSDAVREYAATFTTDQDCFSMIFVTFHYTTTVYGTTYRSGPLSLEY